MRTSGSPTGPPSSGPSAGWLPEFRFYLASGRSAGTDQAAATSGLKSRPGRGRRPEARGARSRPASGNSRVTPRRRRAPRGEAVADRWRLRTGSAHCAPQLPNRPPARPPPVRRVSRRESPVVGAEPEAVPAASSSSRFPSSLPLALRPPSRLRHPPAPHTQDENALPGTTQQHLDGFGHGPAVAYPQHHLQPLRLGESLQAAAPSFCHCGSALPQRVPPNATAHAPRLFPGLGTQAAANPPHPHLTGEQQ